MNFNNPKWILDHITIALQCTSDECIVKRPCDLDGIEQYLILRGEQDGAHYSVKVVPVLLSNAGIEENDLVIVRRQSSAEYGNIVVAIDENNENTLKRFMYDKKKKRPYLHPENDKYDDIYQNEIKIQGVAVKVIKNLEG